ncbi:seryl-tRNA synthetase [Pseudozyma hubeiensis SY62]|uniref:Seryl-tRNA synthetase n=1 Tax=Pseudozyma hubeiensis (strain SY62) TaxID=1305764 RepID=R9PBQ2_PSEHS|nr:seryl-tRNA synthetase [Pseudozyma hubeiensis SY62]GAC98672.1 seryl-tRNA synthetase [Pseudozyma hubeiensis SY62]
MWLVSAFPNPEKGTLFWSTVVQRGPCEDPFILSLLTPFAITVQCSRPINVMAAVQASSSLELDTLTLDHILSDLESLAPNDALFSVTRTSAKPSGSRSDAGLLESFEAGTSPSDRRQHVELSHRLLAGHRTAQRLNSERVSEVQVGLVLPSERSRASTRSSASARPRGRDGLGETSTRTDLLHAKVADLQTQVDAWHTALESAATLIDEPHQSLGTSAVEDVGANRKVRAEDTSLESGTMSQDHTDARPKTTEPIPTEARYEAGAPAAIEGPNAVTSAEEFEDDDPWDEMS